MNKLTIRDAEIVFANLVDEGFGTTLTVKVNDELEKAVTAFYSENKIGNEKTVIGKPTFKEYEGKKQISFKINDKTKFHYMNGLTRSSLGFGAKIDFVLNAFEYSNKFTKGKSYIGASISAVIVKSGKKDGTDEDLSDLLNGCEVEPQFTGETEATDPKMPF